MRKSAGVACAIVAVCGLVVTLRAHAPSGAIFTTVADGSEVNYNIYQAKEDVYLDGGPGRGAPQHAAGLDDGVYVFQVTDPSGKTLLSTDPAGCRLFTVTDGVISSTAPSNLACAHVTGVDVDHNATTVQLMPYDDTPNPGGEYKVWVTSIEDYVCNDNLALVDCGAKKGGVAHGFVPRHSKTDNYKVRGTIREIDTRFFRTYGDWIDGLGITWTDPLGGSNKKWSYLDTSIDVNHEAHVEAVEDGTHLIAIAHQAGCTVGDIYVAGVRLAKSGPQTVKINVAQAFASGNDTVFIDVQCR